MSLFHLHNFRLLLYFDTVRQQAKPLYVYTGNIYRLVQTGRDDQVNEISLLHSEYMWIFGINEKLAFI